MLRFSVELAGNRQLVTDLRQMAEAFVEGSSESKQAEVEIAGQVADIAPFYTPIVSGSLASAHAVFVDADETYVAIDPSAGNPWSDEKPSEYGPKVHAMGGFSRSGQDRAFYDTLIRQEGERLLDNLEDAFVGTLRVFK